MVLFVVFSAQTAGAARVTFSFMLGVVLAVYAGPSATGGAACPAAKVLTLAAAVLLYGQRFSAARTLPGIASKFLLT
jgi:hypothetical protein